MKRVGDLLGSLNLPEDRPERSLPSLGSARLAADPVCPICKGKGYLVRDVPPEDPDFGRPVPCRCTEARLAQERAESLRTVSNLGQLSRMTFDTFIPTGVGISQLVRFNLEQAFDLSREFAGDPKGWLVLLGGYGCGKTHLAAAIANQRLALGHPVMFVVVPDLLDFLRGAYAPGSTSTFDERLDAICQAPLLVLDDLGAHNSTPWAQEKLFQIVNYRYNGRLPTVITTNQRLEELDPRICSRLADPDMSQVYEILAPDFRQPGSERGGSSSLSTLTLHGDQTFDSFSLRGNDSPFRDNLRSAVARARAFAEKPSGWLIFSGASGCGKTHLAAAIANHQIGVNRAMPMFVVVADLLDHLRATFSPNSTTTMDKVFEQVRSAPLLILDDLSVASATPWAREKLGQLLNYRYAARLATVITTNERVDELEPRLASRMLDSTRSTFFIITAPAYYGVDVPDRPAGDALRPPRKPRTATPPRR